MGENSNVSSRFLSTKMEKITGRVVEAEESDVQNKGMNMSH